MPFSFAQSDNKPSPSPPSSARIASAWGSASESKLSVSPPRRIERIRQIPNLVCLVGNHDAAPLGQINLEVFNKEARQSAHWMREHLTYVSIQFLEELPNRKVIDPVTLVHGSPRNPVWEYILDTNTAAANFSAFDTQFCFIGHSHLPAAYLCPDAQAGVTLKLPAVGQVFQLEGRAILNPGSVGQPRDHDPRAAFAIFHSDELTWEPMRVEYDIHSVQERIYKAGLPSRHALRLLQGW